MVFSSGTSNVVRDVFLSTPGVINGSVGITVNFVPVVTTTLNVLSYLENATTAIDSAIIVSDLDSTNLASATISITSGFISSQDILSFTNQNGITGNYNSSTGVLTLTGTATVANYQTALRSITYTNNSDTPNITTRTISFQVNDGSLNSSITSRNIKITAVSDAPVLVNNNFTVNQGNSVIVTNSMLRTTDVDNTDAQLIYTLKSLPANGTLRLNSINLAVNSTFSQSDINNSRVTYIHNGSQTTNDNFNFVVSDGATTTTRISTAVDGTQGNSYSSNPAISADGRYVVFLSNASNLVSGDSTDTVDAFVKDTTTNSITRITRTFMSQGINGPFNPAISADGRYVVFESYASDLVIDDTNGAADIFVKDTTTNSRITRVSTAADGFQGGNSSENPAISANGRYVVFQSEASNLVSGDTNGAADIFVKDTTTNSITRVSTAADGSQGNSESYVPDISADGRYVVFESNAFNLVSGDTNGLRDVFIKDTNTNSITRVSTAANGSQGNGGSENPAISADGRYVVFRSNASNLVSGDTNNNWDVFIKDTTTNSITRVSTAANGSQGNGTSYFPDISADGRYVVFESNAFNLVSGDTNFTDDIFVKDTTTNNITRFSMAADGSEGNSYSSDPAISADGSYVVFTSIASNLVSGDTNGTSDVFLSSRRVINGSVGITVSIGNPYTPIESAGNTKLVKDSTNKYFTQVGTNTPIAIKNGGQQIYQNIYGSDWQTLAAETVNGDNQVLWKNVAGNFLHIWRLDSNWNWVSSEGQYALNSADAFIQETKFGIDANGDGVIGNPTPIESVGNTKLVKDPTNKYFTQIGTNTPTAIKNGGQQIYQDIYAGWQTLAAETVNGDNQVLWKNVAGNFLHIWHLDSNWNLVSGEGQYALNSADAFTQETNFGIDTNSDGIIGNPYSLIESVGNTKLVKDTANKFFAQVGTSTPNSIKNGGQQIFPNIYGSDWQTLAVETVNGDNQVLWKNVAGNYLHIWHLDSNWNWLSSEGQFGLNSAEALTQETNFGIDTNGDSVIGTIGNPYSLIEAAGNTKLVKDTANKFFAQIGTSTPISIKNGGQQIYQDIYAGWQTLAVETVNGDNQVLWKNTNGNYLHIWHLDGNWNWLSSEGQFGLNSANAFTQETSFGIDTNGDGIIGNPYTLIEAAGNTKLVKDPANKYFAQVGTATPIAIQNAGVQIFPDIYPGWQTLAVETVNGDNQVLWKNVAENYLHIWHLDNSWNRVSSEGQFGLNSANAFTQETNFGIDANSDGIIGNPLVIV